MNLPDDETETTTLLARATAPSVTLTWDEAEEIRVALARATGGLRATVIVIRDATDHPVGLSAVGIGEIEAAATAALATIGAAVTRADTR